MTASNTSSYFQGQVYPPETSHSAPTSPVKSHLYSEKSDLQGRLHRRCNSDSLASFPPSSRLWIKSPQVNVEIRTQVASGTNSWCLSVDLSPTSLFFDIAGLCLASANRNCQLSVSTQPPPCKLIFLLI